jgi:hypothetical protein
MAVSTPREAAHKIDLPEQAAFSFPASVPVVVSAGSAARATAHQRRARRVAAHKAKRGSHQERSKSTACQEQKPAAKAASTAAKAPEKKIAQKPKLTAAGSKPTVANAPPKQK